MTTRVMIYDLSRSRCVAAEAEAEVMEAEVMEAEVMEAEAW